MTQFVGKLISVAIVLLAANSLHFQSHADRIIIHKSARTMELLHAGHVIKTYKIALGGDPVGPKTRQGDHKTPEGLYVIDGRNAHSKFHRSLHISYPNATDRERARKLGFSPGGDIFIHGCRTATDSSVPLTVPATGRTAALPLPIRRLEKSGSS